MRMRGRPSRTVAIFLLVAMPAAAADGFRQLMAREITTRLFGHEFTDEVHWSQVFERGGRLRSVSMGTVHAGAWRTRKDMLCLTEGSAGERCFQVWAAGNRIELRRDDGSPPAAGILQKPQPRR